MCKAYKELRHPEMGYALAVWVTEGCFWYQCTKWYLKRGNLKRYAKMHLGFNLM